MTPLSFNVSLDKPSAREVKVYYKTVDSTATVSGNDYVAVASTLTFVPGDTLEAITVNIKGDNMYEKDDSFKIILSSPVNATLAVSQVFGVITNDDSLPTVKIQDASVSEGSTIGNTLSFAITLSNPTMADLNIPYTFTDGSGLGGAIGGVDFDNTTGSLTILSGQTTTTLDVSIIGDTQIEPNDTFTVNITPSAAAIKSSGNDLSAKGTILNDDATSSSSLRISDASVSEKDAGDSSFLEFTVTLSDKNSVDTIKAFYTVRDGSAKVSENDYVNVTGTVVFLPDTVRQTFKIRVNGDNKFEGDETLIVDLYDPENATIADSEGTGTILDNDSRPTISIHSTGGLEGHTGSTTASFKVTLSNPSSERVNVDYITVDSTATIADNDYIRTSASLEFSPNDTLKTININVNGDLITEIG